MERTYQSPLVQNQEPLDHGYMGSEVDHAGFELPKTPEEWKLFFAQLALIVIPASGAIALFLSRI